MTNQQPHSVGLRARLGTVALLCVAATLALLVPPIRAGGAAAAAQAGPAWRLRTYTLRGAAIDFALRYPESLGEDLGGPATVMKNATYARLADLANRFSTKFATDEFGDAGLFGSNEEEGTGRTVPSKPFLGKPFFVGDSFQGAGLFPSEKVVAKDLKQILAGGSEWRLAVTATYDEGKFGRAIFWRSSDAGSLFPVPEGAAVDAKQLELMKYVAAGPLPFGFLIQCHQVEIGGCSEGASLYDEALPRYVNLSVAVLENNSGHPLKFSGFRGGAGTSSKLRLASSDDRALSAATKDLGWASASIVPAGGRLVVPLRIAFSYSDYEYASGDDTLDYIAAKPNRNAVQKFLAEFTTKKKGLEFYVDETKTAIKDATLRSIAFRAWRDPLVKQDFVYGPSFRLASFKVDALASTAARAKSQSLSYTTAEGFGCCPFVSIWDAERGIWLEKGRVLVGRVGLAGAAREVYDLAFAPEKIAVREREAEATLLRELTLEVLGPDGTWHQVPAREPVERGGLWLRHGESRVFEFAVPPTLRSSPARLHLEGYYVPAPGIRVVGSG